MPVIYDPVPRAPGTPTPYGGMGGKPPGLPLRAWDRGVALVPEGRHAVLAIDPGGTTGVVALHVDLAVSLVETCRNGIVMRKAVDVHGTWLQQADQLDTIVVRFFYTAMVENGIPATRCHLVFENYVSRKDQPWRLGNLDPVWVGAGTLAKLPPEIREQAIWQMPSEGLFYMDRLRHLGLWERGSKHKREAMCHAVCRLDKVLAGA